MIATFDADNCPASRDDACCVTPFGSRSQAYSTGTHQFTAIQNVYSAFFGTRLDEILRRRGIDTVVVLGLTTNVCVQSTARDAWQRDYHAITLQDCCAEIGAGSHVASLAWTARNFGTVSTSQEVVAGGRRYATSRSATL